MRDTDKQMAAYITEDQLTSWVHRLTHLVVWTIVVLLHMSMLCVFVAILYLSDTSGTDIYNCVSTLLDNLGLSKAWPVLAFFGVSGATVVSFYIFAVNKIVLHYSLRYVLKYINRK